ncbi:hypothetical protein V1514DRAFT_263663, partial [Lipomyces japonicus]|uniref:uncharacterized protein n=1 Tax=Lipomyces japonicus TaxID=56871 RepID=UPI0034CD9486
SQLESAISLLKHRLIQIDRDENSYLDLKATLETHANVLTRPVLAKVGNRGLVRATVTHTNEIYANAGDGYILEKSAFQAAKMAGRRAEC